jgi:predicted SAM-dependent methyltransferase
MRKYLTKANIKKLIIGRSDTVKLNVGCGTDYKKGWVNIDNNSDNNIEKLDLNWDLRNPLPFDDNSVDFIFNEHFVEHLTVEEAQKTLSDFKRVLKPGGVMRVAMPDLETAIEQYKDPKWKERPYIKRFKLEFVQTKAELLNMGFRWWGHKWFYDWEELERRLKEVGFEKIKRAKHSKSKNLELRNLETRDESILIAEATK